MTRCTSERNVIVVSSDTDWKASFEDIPNVLYLDDLKPLFLELNPIDQTIKGIISLSKQEINESIADQIFNAGYDIDYDPYSEVVEVELDDFDMIDENSDYVILDYKKEQLDHQKAEGHILLSYNTAAKIKCTVTGSLFTGIRTIPIGCLIRTQASSVRWERAKRSLPNP